MAYVNEPDARQAMHSCATSDDLQEPRADGDAVIRCIVQAHRHAVAIAVITNYAWPDINGLKDRLENRYRASLPGMPAEIVQLIGSHVCKQMQLSRLGRTCRTLHSILNRMLYYRESHSPRGDYAWQWALNNQRIETIYRAIAIGARGGTVRHLLVAARAGNYAMLEALLESRNVRDGWQADSGKQSRTDDPVCAAIAAGHTEVVKLLMRHAQSITGEEGVSPEWLAAAAETGNNSLILFLIGKGADVSASKDGGRPPALECAVRNGHLETCQLLIEYGALRHSTAEYGQIESLFVAATSQANDLIIELLINSGCDPRAFSFRGGTLLHEAAESGRVALISVLQKHSIDINAADADGDTALHIAARSRPSNNESERLAMVEALVAHGANLEAIDNIGKSPLQVSVGMKANHRMSEYLVNLGANVHQADQSGNTAIFGVCDIETLKLLLDHGADINVKNNAGGTAFNSACFEADLTLIKAMVKHGADINSIDADGNTAIMSAACCYSAAATVRFLISLGVSPNPAPRINDGNLPLYEALNRGNDVVATILLKAGANVNTKVEDGWTPLHAAVEECSDDVVRLVLERGADPNARSDSGLTPLVSVAYWSPRPPAERVRLLLRYGADATVQVDGMTAIHGHQNRARGDYVDAVRELVLHGVDVNTPASDGRTALLIAARCRKDSLIAWLLEHGADATMADASGITALHEAASVTAAEALLQYGAVLDVKDNAGMTPLMYAARLSAADVVECLLRHGADVAAVCELGRTALHYGAPDRSTLVWFLRHGAEVDAVDNDGETPLFKACDGIAGAKVKLLLEHGADVHKQCHGILPLNKVIARDTADADDILQVLLQHGAQMNRVDENGDIALFLAAENGDLDVVKLLLAHGADPGLVDSNGDTAAEVALRCSEVASRCSHASVANLLREHRPIWNTMELSLERSDSIDSDSSF